MNRRLHPYLVQLFLPALAVFTAFFFLPLGRLTVASFTGPKGFELYLAILTAPRYLAALVNTLVLSGAVTSATLVISGFTGVFLARNDFTGKRFLVSMLTFPLAFPGVVVGFMIILLAGRQGLVGDITRAATGEKIVFAYSMTGLFLGYLYFSIPRVITTIIATAEKLDVRLEEAARSLGASSWRVIGDILIPALAPGLVSSGAICFATSMGAFGTAFTLATNIEVLPIVIYTEFTLLANIGTASALSILLGCITWVALSIARSAAGNTIAASA
jgi:putative spermidine/putrescine transport system permease protein